MSEIEHLDILTSSLESVAIMRLGLGGSYEWSVTALGPTDHDREERIGRVAVRKHKGNDGFTIHIGSDGATRAEALAGCVDLWERHAELLAASEADQ